MLKEKESERQIKSECLLSPNIHSPSPSSDSTRAASPVSLRKQNPASSGHPVLSQPTLQREKASNGGTGGVWTEKWKREKQEDSKEGERETEAKRESNKKRKGERDRTEQVDSGRGHPEQDREAAS